MEDSPFHAFRRPIFIAFATAATLIGLGVQLLSGNPFWAVLVVVVSVLYLLFEANFNPWSIQNIPGMFRLLFTVLIGCALLGLYLRPILKRFRVGPQAVSAIADPEKAKKPPEKCLQSAWVVAKPIRNSPIKTSCGHC
jgi:hypothetical protein